VGLAVGDLVGVVGELVGVVGEFVGVVGELVGVVGFLVGDAVGELVGVVGEFVGVVGERVGDFVGALVGVVGELVGVVGEFVGIPNPEDIIFAMHNTGRAVLHVEVVDFIQDVDVTVQSPTLPETAGELDAQFVQMVVSIAPAVVLPDHQVEVHVPAVEREFVKVPKIRLSQLEAI
jgi:hypothetical protein